MKSAAVKVLVVVATFTCALALVWMFSGKDKEPALIGFDAALSTIRDRGVEEARFSSDSLELVSRDGETFVTKLDGSDATRMSLLGAIDEVNKVRPNSIKTTLVQPSSDIGMMLIVNLGPILIIAGVAIVSFFLGRVSWRQ